MIDGSAFPVNSKRYRVHKIAIRFLSNIPFATANEISFHINSEYKWGVSSHEVAFVLSRSHSFEIVSRYSGLSNKHNLWRLSNV